MKTIVDGTLKSSGTSWKLDVDGPVTPNEIRMIAGQLHAAADALESRRPDDDANKS
jgi:hypothetical protein